jgi:hypothetical protein
MVEFDDARLRLNAFSLTIPLLALEIEGVLCGDVGDDEVGELPLESFRTSCFNALLIFCN